MPPSIEAANSDGSASATSGTRRPEVVWTARPPSATTIEAFAQLLRASSGLAIGADKVYLLESRLAPIGRGIGVADLDALAERMRSGSSELRGRIVEAMTTNESLFFRDGKPFEHFRHIALPRLHAARAGGVPLRLWSAAASTGQEPYSLSMIVEERRELLQGRTVEIVGTDIAPGVLARARAGLYSQFEVQRGLPIRTLAAHFHKEGAAWRINDSVRSRVALRVWNLLDDPRPLGRFDVVCCRNVLIYFDGPTKRRVLEAIADILAPDGFLYLGGAETPIGLTSRFTAMGAEHGVFGVA